MLPLRLPLLALLVLALSGACTAITGPGTRGLQVEVGDASLLLRNRSSQPIYYTVFERNFAARVLWGPCTTPGQCPSVPSGRTVTVPYDSIPGYEPGATEAIVYWWHLVPSTGGGFRPDSVRAEVVEL